MILRRLLSTTLAAALCAPGAAWPQEARIEQARQIDHLSSALLGPVNTAAPAPLEITEGGDRESFGVQQLLRDAERLRPFRAFADVSAFVTNNVALSRKDPLVDAFLVASFGFEYRRQLPRGFQVEASVRYTAFRYDRYRVLDFNSLDLGVGVSYHTEKLGGLDFFARYGFNELLNADTEDVFFTNHTILLGAQKVIPFSQAHYTYFGGSGQLGFADPEVSERSELAAFAGYHLQATRHLQADLTFRYSWQIYTEGERRDHNSTVSLGLRYEVTEWCALSASAYAGWNRSNFEVFDYDTANAGLGLTLSIQF